MRVEFKPLSRDWEEAFAVEDGCAVLRPAGNLFDKDIQHAAHFAEAHGVDAPVTRAAAESAKSIVASWRSSAAG